MKNSRFSAVVAAFLVGVLSIGTARGQACPVTCVATKTETTTGAIPATAGLNLSVDFATAVNGTALTGCIASSACDDCVVAIAIDFGWTGTPAGRYTLRLTNHNGTSTVSGSYVRTGMLYRDCPDPGKDYLFVELLDGTTVVYSHRGELTCHCP